MQITTCQMAQSAKMKGEGWTVMDITVKSGNKAFAPTWDMVLGYKDKKITEEEYTEQYLSMMRESFKNNHSEWATLLKVDRLCLACYCKSGDFCHRHLLKEYIANYAEDQHVVPVEIIEEATR